MFAAKPVQVTGYQILDTRCRIMSPLTTTGQAGMTALRTVNNLLNFNN